jgi:hypothetical protein
MSMVILGGKNAKYSAKDNDESYVIEEDEELPEDDEDEYGPEFGAYDKHGKKHKSTVKYGGHGRGKIVSLKCHSPA